MAPRTTHQRIPRDEGTELLIDAAMEIARAVPVSRVTVRDIAARAGLQTMHVKRYFGGRNELLVAVSNRLMTRIVDALADRPVDTVFAYLQDNRDVELRLRIISHLQDEGVPPDAFAGDHEVYLRIAERISAVNGVGTRTARAYAHVIQLVLQGNRLMGDVNGLTPRERRDIFELLTALSAGLSPAERSLDWGD